MDRLAIALSLCGLVAAVTLGLRLHSRSGELPKRVDPRELGLTGSGMGVVAFSTTHCLPCRAWESALGHGEVAFVKVDVSERPELALRYGIRETPVIFAVRLPHGEVVEAFTGEPHVDDVEHLRQLAGGVPAPA